jgi:alkanesulfonate monooxygenase SsuD/methylene tetrahydromethanopterin reductase-like flavin-dependent oxidoreductase (luciferase family)
MDTLAFGIFESLSATGTATAGIDYESMIADVQLAERSGYRYYFVIEHQSTPYPGITSPNVYLTAVARATSTIRIGAMVYQLPFHHPVRLAQDIATLDHLSKGRVEFGLGYGVAVKEFECWGVDYAERRAMGVEALEIIFKAWTGEPFSYQGTYWTFRDAIAQPRPYQQPHPRIWMGAHSHASFDYAAEQNLHLAQNIDVERVIGEKYDYFRQKWASHAHGGPQPKTMIVRHVHVAETDALAIAQSEPYMRQGLAGQRGVNLARSVRPDASAERRETARIYLESTSGYDFWVGEGLAFVGSPETVARQIAQQRERIGYDILLAHHHITTMPDHLVRNSVQLFGERVIPAFGSPVNAA